MARFDSHLFEPQERYDAWRDSMSLMFEVQPREAETPREGARARVSAANLGEALFGLTEAPAQQFRRDNRLIVQEEMACILVQVFIHGGGSIVGQERIRAGDMLIIDLAQPHQMLNDDFRNLTLMLPKALSPELSALLERLHSQRIAGDNPLVGLIRDHLVTLWSGLALLSPDQAGFCVQGTLGLLGGWLGHDPQIQEQFKEPTGLALVAAITRYIDRHLGHPLSVAELTHTFGISRTQLYRLLKPHGGVASYVWERRLQQSLRLLLSPTLSDLTLSLVAYRSGFTSEAHFSRRFRQRFGLAPGQVRAEFQPLAQDNAALPSPVQDPRFSFRRLIEYFVKPLDTGFDGLLRV